MPGTAPNAAFHSADWPGKHLGLPESGPRSIARPGRRILALAIDWGISYLVSFAFFRPDTFGFATLTIFVVSQIVFVLLLNGSVGHLITGLRVVPLRGGYLGLWRPLVRPLLIAVVLPAVIWDRDQRGMHDRAIGTMLVRR